MTELFDWAEKIARDSDPITSHVAAANTESSLSGLRAKFAEGVARCGGSATAKEAANAMSRNPELAESIRKRAKECVERGYVTCEGVRRCQVSGHSCSVYHSIKSK
jgi:hypothetical protein